MTGTSKANVLRPAMESAIVFGLAALATYWGLRYNVSGFLDTWSMTWLRGLDVANLGPGVTVLAIGLGVIGARRWREAVTERATLSRTRDVLAGTEARYSSLTAVSPAPILLVDSRGSIAYVNDATVDLLRAPSPQDLVGLPFFPFVDPESQPVIKERTARLLAGDHLPTAEVRLRRVDGSAVVVQLMSAPAMIDGAPGIQSVLQDVTHLSHIADTLRRATIDTVEAMARLAETRDPYTAGHQERVSRLAEAMAEYMGLPPQTIEAVRVAGVIHDIGKMNVPVEILAKPGRLSEAEFDLIKTHADRGCEILRPIAFPWPIADIVWQHHERLNGSGYPLGLSGPDILLEARILAVADTVEAVASNRPYRPALGLDAAFAIIREGSGTLYDEKCVDACLAVAADVIAEAASAA